MASRYAKLVVKAPPEGLRGNALCEVIGRVLDVKETPWVAACDMDVSGVVRPLLLVSAREIRVWRSDELLSLLAKAEQVLWASLFFCRDQSRAIAIQTDERYETSAEKADFVIRAVEAGEVRIFAAEAEYSKWVQAFPEETPTLGELSESDFPE